ncbi:MAG: hypothetical protein PHP42_02925 [Bacteroidota bacterium]|nr:hypothetical protein [Bacteroidota bacterium]
MKWFSLILLFALCSSTSIAQTNIVFSGYVMDVPTVQRLNEKLTSMYSADQTQFSNVTRVRLRPSVNITEDAQISIEYEIASLYHSSSSIFSLQNESLRGQVVQMRWNPVSEQKYSVIHFIDRLYYRQSFSFGDISIGRQRIAWGSGRIWNPTDLFNPLNPTSFAKVEKDGVDALTTKLRIGDFTDLTLVFNPQKEKQSNAGFRFRTNYSEYDLSLLGGRFDERLILGGDIAGNFFNAGLRGEGIMSAQQDNLKSSFAKFIVGLDYQFTSALYGLIEYHFNGEGKIDKLMYDVPRLAKGEILNLNRSYLAVTGSLLVHPLVTTSLMMTANLNDNSQFVAGTISYAATDELALVCGGQVFMGNTYSEYWYYPNSFYIKADIYF